MVDPDPAVLEASRPGGMEAWRLWLRGCLAGWLAGYLDYMVLGGFQGSRGTKFWNLWRRMSAEGGGWLHPVTPKERW